MTAGINTELYARVVFTEESRGLEDRKSSWRGPASLLLAAAIHLFVLLQFGGLIKPDILPVQQESLIEVELVTTASASEAPKEVVTKSEPEKLKPVPQPPRPVVKPKPARIKKPLKEQHKIVRSAPQAQHVKKITSQIEQAAVQQSPIATPTITQHTAPVRDRRTEQDRLNRLRKQYLTAIISDIEAHKRYPYSARRRHLQGNVDISFMVDLSGQVSDIQIKGDSSILRASSMDALQASGPFPPLPKEMAAPIRCHCIMQYQLNR